ncbi:hypothetical protein DPX16_15087 [Anabarilius grahami]|uniref:Uncharacterized protein n=1 Tax=Anabarilius grahami TaxID=495550 RepID=A0A3N0YY16_ANAGA|nr:hypothetical protein DPX16_15087 [Anabarilius grahami]
MLKDKSHKLPHKRSSRYRNSSFLIGQVHPRKWDLSRTLKAISQCSSCSLADLTETASVGVLPVGPQGLGLPCTPAMCLTRREKDSFPLRFQLTMQICIGSSFNAEDIDCNFSTIGLNSQDFLRQQCIQTLFKKAEA